MQNNLINTQSLTNYKPTTAYVGATWAILSIGIIAFFFGLLNATGLIVSEKGFYVAVMALGLYSAISLQKTIRDKAEGIPTSMLYYWISWGALGIAVGLITVGLMSATGLSLSEKGFYMMSFTMSLFAAITVQKNTRDNAQIRALQAGSTTSHLTYSLNDSSDTSTKSMFGSIRSKAQPEDIE